jgi:hypothetical protein
LPSVDLQEDEKFVAFSTEHEHEDVSMQYVTNNKTAYSANEKLLDFNAPD